MLFSSIYTKGSISSLVISTLSSWKSNKDKYTLFGWICRWNLGILPLAAPKNIVHVFQSKIIPQIFSLLKISLKTRIKGLESVSADRKLICYQGLKLCLGCSTHMFNQDQGLHSKPKFLILTLKIALKLNIESWLRCSFQGPELIS